MFYNKIIVMKNFNLVKFTGLLAVALCSFLVFGRAEAAQVYFELPSGSSKVGDEFSAALFLDTEGITINAVEFKILIPELLKIKSISKGSSVIKLWVNEPSFSGKTISLAGGVPGGLTSSKGLIARINLQAAAVGEGNIALMPESAIFLNDGQGTKLDLKTVGGPVFQVIPKGKETIPSVSKAPEKKETKKPDKFKILFGQDPRVFGDEKFISFFTTDRDTGVDHYEVRLGKGPFKIAQPPYLIKDVPPRTVIRVRAYDTEGNYRETVYPGLFKRSWWWIRGLFGSGQMKV